MVDDIRPGERPQETNSFRKIQNPEVDEPAFVPPEVVAERSERQSEDGSILEDDSGGIGVGGIPPRNSPSSKRARRRFHDFIKKVWPNTKRGRIIASIVLLFIVAGASGGAYELLHKKPAAPTAKAPVVEKKPAAPPPKPTTEPSRLTGVQIPLELNKRHITSIQIENSPDARPQSGLQEAGVVFEAIAEGGITRFNAIFLEGQPDYIGPVRSIRPYYIDFFLPFDASVVHAGGSAEGLAKLTQLNVKDIDHGSNAGAFQRVSDRYAPHNLYTSMAALDQVSNARGHNKTNAKITSYVRKAEKPGQPITAKIIDFNISGFLYNPHYDYNPATNSYLRSMGGQPHTNQRSGKILEPKVVVALVMNWSQNGIYSVYQTTGMGEMYVFQDGQIQKGTWKKAGPREQFEFLDTANKPLALNPGQTWFSIVGDPSRIKHTP